MSPERKIGLVASTAIVLLLGGVFLIGQFHLGFTGYPIDVRFAFVNNLKEHAAVKYAGGPVVGHVRTMTVTEDLVTVRLNIDRELRIREDCAFLIYSAGMLGEQYVEIRRSGSGKAPFLEPGAVVRGVDPMSVDEALAKFGAIVDVLAPVFERDDVATAAGGVVQDLRRMSRTLAALVEHRAGDLDESVGHLAEFSRRLSGLARDLDALQRGLAPVAAAKGPASLSLAVSRANAALARVDETAEILAGLARKLEDGQGLLGRLIRDEELARDFKALIKKLKDEPVRAKVKLF